ncbi:MAG TPA: hypothetical protein PK691_00155 [Thermomicrobiales bacterium]|nr:hypothetical protein [Thermomicrobiales bacterium]HRA47329.1 hypothetical protein [Thermomicrobiales bacterium]
MFKIILTALGASLAATGFMFIGIADSIMGGNDAMMNSGWVMLIGGSIATLVGGLWYRSSEAKAQLEYSRIQK